LLCVIGFKTSFSTSNPRWSKQSVRFGKECLLKSTTTHSTSAAAIRPTFHHENIAYCLSNCEPKHEVALRERRSGCFPYKTDLIESLTTALLITFLFYVADLSPNYQENSCLLCNHVEPDNDRHGPCNALDKRNPPPSLT
jgi:hypothetical protein